MVPASQQSRSVLGAPAGTLFTLAPMEHISWIAVLVGAVTLFVLGAVWYSALFAKAFREELGVGDGDEPGMDLGKALIGQFIAGLVLSLVLAWLIGPSGSDRGLGIGLAGGLLVAAALGQFYLFEGRTIRHLAINVGYILIGLAAVGAIIGAIQG